MWRGITLVAESKIPWHGRWRISSRMWKRGIIIKWCLHVRKHEGRMCSVCLNKSHEKFHGLLVLVELQHLFHCTTNTSWDRAYYISLIPKALQLGIVSTNDHATLRTFMEFLFNLEEMNVIPMWKSLLQFCPNFIGTLIINHTCTNVFWNQIEKPWF